MNYEQYEMYIDYLGKKEKNLSQLCEHLNAVPGGSKKNLREWQEAFSNWQRAVKHKARAIYVSQHLTGGGFPTPKILTVLEEKLLCIIGILCIHGMLVPELGFKNPNPSRNVIKKKRTPKKTVVYQIKKSKIRETKLQKKILSSLKYNVKMVKKKLKLLVESVWKLAYAMKRILKLLLDSKFSF
ncbi:unnamed protein product [Ceutorhynchus assimilis]|uniref:Uncharacterized protein n=2 Tax=Ceutorhynchus assimilis TaxID=467358 RepID=A0A9N9QSB7_9CUCU|nr:unnamed protein product [Ceutorhynchus assimilis]CAG9773435.1 unnamed protein product [Ceutorhynchus assimilis]CAG9773637.1 unnamed protein product [Ceutorhynchus assimilis]